MFFNTYLGTPLYGDILAMAVFGVLGDCYVSNMFISFLLLEILAQDSGLYTAIRNEHTNLFRPRRVITCLRGCRQSKTQAQLQRLARILMGHDARNPVFVGLRTTQAQTSLRIRAAYVNLLRVKFQFSVAEKTGLKLALSNTPKTGFLATRPILCSPFVSDFVFFAYNKVRFPRVDAHLKVRAQNYNAYL